MPPRRLFLALGAAGLLTGCVRSSEGIRMARLPRVSNPFNRPRDYVAEAYKAAGGAAQALFRQTTITRPDGRVIPVRLVAPAVPDGGIGLLVLSPDAELDGMLLDPMAGPLAASGWLVAVPTHAAPTRDALRDHLERLADLRILLDSGAALIAAGGPTASRLDREIVAAGGTGVGGLAALNLAGAVLSDGRSYRDGRVQAAFAINPPAGIGAEPINGATLEVPTLTVTGGGGRNPTVYEQAPTGRFRHTLAVFEGPDAVFGGAIGPLPTAPRGRRRPLRTPPSTQRRLAQLQAASALAGVFLDATAKRNGAAAEALSEAAGRELEGLAAPLDVRQR